jgi:hypothetical protein
MGQSCREAIGQVRGRRSYQPQIAQISQNSLARAGHGFGARIVGCLAGRCVRRLKRESERAASPPLAANLLNKPSLASAPATIEKVL